MSTYTLSASNTYSATAAKAVMQSVGVDLHQLVHRGFTTLTVERVERWSEVVLYLMDKKVLEYFQLQFTMPDGTKKAITYTIRSQGSFSTNDDPGGLYVVWDMPVTTRVGILVSGNWDSETEDYLARKGWGEGQPVQGQERYDRGYSKDNYGVERKFIGL